MNIYPEGIQSMAFDHNSNPERLFWAMYDTYSERGRLIEIDPVSGYTVSRGAIGQNAEIAALYIPYPADVKINLPESNGKSIRL
jgi:hypothetical protein